MRLLEEKKEPHVSTYLFDCRDQPQAQPRLLNICCVISFGELQKSSHVQPRQDMEMVGRKAENPLGIPASHRRGWFNANHTAGDNLFLRLFGL